MRAKKIKPFRISTTTITNEAFSEFVEATGYVTEAEIFGWSFVFWTDVPESIQESRGVEGVDWWRRIDGANWRDICGPNTQDEIWISDHPVEHVPHKDALAYPKQLSWP